MIQQENTYFEISSVNILFIMINDANNPILDNTEAYKI